MTLHVPVMSAVLVSRLLKVRGVVRITLWVLTPRLHHCNPVSLLFPLLMFMTLIIYNFLAVKLVKRSSIV